MADKNKGEHCKANDKVFLTASRPRFHAFNGGDHNVLLSLFNLIRLDTL